jgi:hypothetical protein
MLRRSVLLGMLVAIVLVLALAGPALAFTDVPAYDPYAKAIDSLSTRGIVNGFDDGTFRPNDVVTRQQFAKMIVKTLGLAVSEQDVCTFPDVNPGQASADPLYPDNYIAVAVAHQITKGYDDGTFRPYLTISRAHVITMVVRAIDSLYPKVLNEDTAGSQLPENWMGLLPEHAASAIIADTNGLLDGIDLTQSEIDMSAAMPRGEVAQILYNLASLVPPEIPVETYEGTGNDVVTLDKPAGPALLYARCENPDTEFYILAFDKDGNQVYETLAAGYGPYEGVTPLDFGWMYTTPSQRAYRLQVTATGPWTLEVRPLSAAPSVGPGDTIDGAGDQVFRLEDGVATAVIQGGSDDDYLAVDDFDLVTQIRGTLVFAQSPYFGRVVTLSPGYVAVHTMSPWSFAAESSDR